MKDTKKDYIVIAAFILLIVIAVGKDKKSKC